MSTHSLKNVVRYKLAEAFAEVCSALSTSRSTESLQASLLEWSLPSDRPVPVVFLDYPLERLIAADFDALFDTAGVGPKKFAVLVQILQRAAGLEELNLLAANPLAGDREAAEIALADDGYEGLRERFQQVRNEVLSLQCERLLAKRVDYWVLPTDRQVPRNVLDRSLGELLSGSFDSIAALPGVGRKKIAVLIELLTRAHTAGRQWSASAEGTAPSDRQASLAPTAASPALIWENTDEATWSLWRSTIVRLKLEHEPLGRYTRALATLARPLWRAPLGRFVTMTMAELASQGDLTPKQGRDVLEVFADLHSIVERLGSESSHLSIGIVPRISNRLNAWAALACEQPGHLTVAEIKRKLVDPLLAQLQVDLGKRTVRLEELWAKVQSNLDGRLQVDAAWPGDGSARATLLIDDVRAAVEVRWREGAAWLRRLSEHATAAQVAERECRMIDAAGEFFFPRFSTAGEPAPVRSRSVSAPREMFPLAPGHRGPRSPAPNSRPGVELRHMLRVLDPLNPARVEAR